MTDTVRVEVDVVYGVAGRDLHCDVYHPAPAAANGAAVMLFHGGGLRVGSPTTMKDAATRLAERGYLAVAPEYRLLAEAPWPAQIHDTRTAIRWLRFSAGQFRVDPDMIALCGFSAGAHLALLAAGTADGEILPGDGGHEQVSERVAAVVAFFSPARQGASGASDAGVSAEQYMSGGFPPVLLLHGTGDTLVPHAVSMHMFETLSAAGASADLRLYAGLPHEFQQLPGILDACVADVDAFLRRHIVTRAHFDSKLAELRRRWEERAQARG